jgi:hypothetical protein
MELKPEVLDKLLEGVKTQEDLAGPGGLLKQITKALVERMLGGELSIIWATKSTRKPVQARATPATAKAEKP